MCPFAKEFSLLARTNEYSDLLEDTEWGVNIIKKFNFDNYSELLEDTEWRN